jgi:hypothetical protein
MSGMSKHNESGVPPGSQMMTCILLNLTWLPNQAHHLLLQVTRTDGVEFEDDAA